MCNAHTVIFLEVKGSIQTVYHVTLSETLHCDIFQLITRVL